MKRISYLFLTALLVLGLSLTAAAAAPNTQEVKATYKAALTKTVYNVDITWEGLSFTYQEGSKGTWNPETHSYDDPQPAGWAPGTGTITMTNHSNAAVTARILYRSNPGFEQAGMTFSQDRLMIGSADNGGSQPGQPLSGSVSVTPSGVLPPNTQNASIGTITIQIS